MTHKEQYSGKELADNYIRYRPTYPEKIFDTITSYHRQSGHATWELAVDVACGSGQATLPLAKYFKKVIGVDVSEDQLNIAKSSHSNPNVTFRFGPGEDLSFLEPGSVDLITCATAVHWMDRDKFFKEVYRVLKPKGTLALYAYGPLNCDTEAALLNRVTGGVLADYYVYTETTYIGKDRYEHLAIPLMEDRKWIGDLGYYKSEWTVDEYVNFMKSTHFIDKYSTDHPEHDLGKEMREKLFQELRRGNEPDENVRVRQEWVYHMVMARKPL